MMRRTEIAFSSCRGLDCVETVARSMGDLLNWTEESIQSQIETYKMEVDIAIPRFEPKSAND